LEEEEEDEDDEEEVLFLQRERFRERERERESRFTPSPRFKILRVSSLSRAQVRKVYKSLREKRERDPARSRFVTASKTREERERE